MKTIPTPNDTPWTYYPDPTRPRQQRVTNIDRLNRRNSLQRRGISPVTWAVVAAAGWVALIVVGVKVGEWLGR